MNVSQFCIACESVTYHGSFPANSSQWFLTQIFKSVRAVLGKIKIVAKEKLLRRVTDSSLLKNGSLCSSRGTRLDASLLFLF